jgi:hypothetical protein
MTAVVVTHAVGSIDTWLKGGANRKEVFPKFCSSYRIFRHPDDANRVSIKAGLRLLERSALVEAVAHLTRAIEQLATLPPSTSVRREQIKLHSAIITSHVHVKGLCRPETKAAAEQTKLLIEQAEALGETPEDPRSET